MKIDELVRLLNRAKETYGNVEVKVIKNRERRDVALFTWSLLLEGILKLKFSLVLIETKIMTLNNVFKVLILIKAIFLHKQS